MSWRVFTDFTSYLLLRILVCIVQALPLEVCEALARGLATVFTRVVQLRHKTIEENLQIAYPAMLPGERRQLTWAMWRHLFLMSTEIALTPRKVHRTNWRQHSHIPQVDTIVRQLLSDRPLVFISGHYGNFELGGYLLGLFGFPTHTIARTLDNPFLDRFVNQFRGRTGQHILDKHGCSEEIDRLLRAGGRLTLLGDQAAGKKGCWVDFFGRPASTHKGVALFSLNYQAPTMVIYARRRDHALQYDVGVVETVDPASPEFQMASIPLLSEWYTRCLEQMIRDAPQQYWWVHRRWKGRPPQRSSRSPKLHAA